MAVGAALGSRATLALDAGGTALLLGAVQAVASSWLLRGALPPARRGWAGVAAVLMLGGLALGARHSPAAGLHGLAGASHALLHAGLLALFAGTMRQGRTPLVTRLARRLTPGFHPGMEGYTRAVTRAWCMLFAGELAGSATDLSAAPAWWPAVTGLPGLLPVLALAVVERTVRARRFPGMAHTSVPTVIRAMRAGGWRLPSDADAAAPAAGCPGRSGSATPRPPPARDSAPGPAA